MNMPAWYPLPLDPWQLSLKFSNSATELLSDWLEHGRPFARSRVRIPPWVIVFFPPFFLVFIFHLSLSMTLTRLKACQVWSMLTIEPTPRTLCSVPPLSLTFASCSCSMFLLERSKLHSNSPTVAPIRLHSMNTQVKGYFSLSLNCLRASRLNPTN